MRIEEMKSRASAKKTARSVKKLNERVELTGTGKHDAFKKNVKYSVGAIIARKLKKKGYLK